jgi:hypothetical protein
MQGSVAPQRGEAAAEELPGAVEAGLDGLGRGFHDGGDLGLRAVLVGGEDERDALPVYAGKAGRRSTKAD